METYTRHGKVGCIDYTKDKDGNIEVVAIQTFPFDKGDYFKNTWDDPDVIYVSEAGVRDFANRKENGVEFEDVAWTREKWLDHVREELRWAFEGCAVWTDEGFVEHIAKDIFEYAEGDELSTRLDEWLETADVNAAYGEYRGRCERKEFLEAINDREMYCIENGEIHVIGYFYEKVSERAPAFRRGKKAN